MNIGKASQLSGVSTKMIRYYEEIGLVPAAPRSASGYRSYDDRGVHILRFIARSRDLGFRVADISDLLNLWQDKDRRSADVKALARARVHDLRQKILHLQGMAETLERLADCCAGNDRPECPILQELQIPQAAAGPVFRPALAPKNIP